MSYKPSPYQMEAARFLVSRPHAGLFLDMGLRKTAISLMAMEALKNPRTLLIAPLRVLYTVWPTEIAKWGFSQKYVNLHDNREALFSGPPADIYGINPESSLSLIQDPRFQAQVFDLLIIDESSLYKAYDSRRFRLLQRHLHRFSRRWILTGTPAPNGLMDLWSQIYILDRGASLGEYITRFRNAFCIPNWNGCGYSLTPGAEDEIYRRIKPLVLRMDAKDHLDMPKLVKNSVMVTLNAKARKMYEEMEQTFLLRLEQDVIMSPNAAAVGMRCRQIANGGIYLTDGSTHHIHTHKSDALKEIIEEMQGRPVIVFYEFVHDVQRIKTVLGDVPEASVANIQAFAEGRIPVLLGHPGSMGHGLNLQDHCNTVIWMGIPWDLGAYDQAIARVYRSGQKQKQVIVHHIIAQDTLDEVVLKTLSLKSRTQRDLLDAMKEKRHDRKATRQ